MVGISQKNVYAEISYVGPLVSIWRMVNIKVVFQKVQDSEVGENCCWVIKIIWDLGSLHTALHPYSFRALKLDITYKQFVDIWV